MTVVTSFASARVARLLRGLRRKCYSLNRRNCIEDACVGPFVLLNPIQDGSRIRDRARVGLEKAMSGKCANPLKMTVPYAEFIDLATALPDQGTTIRGMNPVPEAGEP